MHAIVPQLPRMRLCEVKAGIGGFAGSKRIWMALPTRRTMSTTEPVDESKREVEVVPYVHSPFFLTKNWN
jgi:hypothetical protein